MKLLYVVILLLGAIQWVRTKPLEASTNSNVTLSPEEQLVKFYDDKLVLLAPEICLKLNHLTKEILKDETVQLATTPFMIMFKRTIEDFRIIYTFHTRFEFQSELPWEFADKIDDYYPPKSNANKDALYISELLGKVGYEELRNKYKTEMKKFVTEKFLPKYEELNSRQPSNNTEYAKKLKKWVMVLKECREYECYLNDFAKSSQTILQQIFVTVFHKIFEVGIIFSHNATTFAKDVVKDPKLLQLSPLVGHQLKQNLQDFIKINDTLDHPLLVDMVPGIFYPIIFKFDNYTSLSTKDRQLITNIFDDHGYTKLELNRIIKKDTHHYESNDYVKEYQNFIATMNQKDLPKFLDAIDKFKRANTTEERMTALKGIGGFNIVHTES